MAIANIETITPRLAIYCAAIIDELSKMNITCDEFKSYTIGITAGAIIIGSLLNVYIWIFNYSYYKKLKEVEVGSSVKMP